MKPLNLLVLGTSNRKKAIELERLFGPLGLTIKTLADYPAAIDVVEDGDSFAANAAKKATQQARHLDAWVLGEDSGIEIDALDGRPGIYSARYSGPSATDSSNNEKLLEELGDLPPNKRGARYVCHMTLSDPTGEIRCESEAYCRGRIRREPSGEAGFGYDPLFEIEEFHQTFSQLGDTVKTVLSHRARATRMLLPQLGRIVRLGGSTA